MGSSLPDLLGVTWTDGLFVHWPFDPAAVRATLPEPLTVDTRDGRAWVSATAFVLADGGPRVLPRALRREFPQLNFRTYVRLDGTPGIYLYSVEADDPLVSALVGKTTRLPYRRADATVERDGRYHFETVRDRGDGPPARFVAEYAPDGGVYTADPGSFDDWIAERYRLYDPRGRGVLYARVDHDPWPLQPADATVRENTLFETVGLPAPAGDRRRRSVPATEGKESETAVGYLRCERGVRAG